jgi:hypothetical protein
MTRPILYIPSRIRVGARPSVHNCFGCPEVANRPYQRGMLRICGVTGTTFRQTPACPKLSKKNMDERTVSLAVDRPARTTTALHE